MNVLETYTIESPYGKSEECAKLSIFDTAEWFILSDTTAVGIVYTFSAWIKSDADGSFTVGESYIRTSNKWARYKATFTADDVDLKLIFSTPGTYYLYNTQLEVGNLASDWSPAPEDLDPTDELFEVHDRVQNIYQTVTEFGIKNDEISGSVKEVEKRIDDTTGELTTVKDDIASIKLKSDSFTVAIEKFEKDGSTKVTTTTGVFDNAGLTIDNDVSPTKTTVTPDGMTVYKKVSSTENKEVLKATTEGVDATNLHANTYLIIGGRSRFENYGTNRTGCFWIGG